jgi:hypothetical protein
MPLLSHQTGFWYELAMRATASAAIAALWVLAFQTSPALAWVENRMTVCLYPDGDPDTSKPYHAMDLLGLYFDEGGKFGGIYATLKITKRGADASGNIRNEYDDLDGLAKGVTIAFKGKTAELVSVAIEAPKKLSFRQPELNKEPAQELLDATGPNATCYRAVIGK